MGVFLGRVCVKFFYLPPFGGKCVDLKCIDKARWTIRMGWMDGWNLLCFFPRRALATIKAG